MRSVLVISETLAVLTVFEDQSFFFFLTLEISQ